MLAVKDDGQKNLLDLCEFNCYLIACSLRDVCFLCSVLCWHCFFLLGIVEIYFRKDQMAQDSSCRIDKGHFHIL